MNPFELIADFIKVAKDHIKDGNYNPIRGEWPELYPGYKEACRQRDLIAIHSTSSEFPRLAFERLLKNMDENGLLWLEDNYQPITHSVYNDFLNTISRATHNVIIEDAGVDEKYLDYLYKELPEYENINAYNKYISPSLIIQDAMAVFTVTPERVEVEEVDSETAQIVGDINPTPQYFECFRIISMSKDHCLILRAEKSLVKWGSTTRRSGLIFDYYDKENIIRLEQTGKQTDFTFVETMVFPHGLDFMPALRAGGIPKIEYNKVAYTSHFYGAVPHLNLAMHDSVYLSSVKRKCAFPTPVMVVDDCNYSEHGKEPCNGGYLKYFDEKLGEMSHSVCPKCKGTGKEHALNPFTTMFAPATNRENDTKYSASDVLTYVSPDPAMMELLRKEVELQLTKAAMELKISRSTNQEGGNVTATERGIDLKATYAFIKSFADLLVDRWNWQIYTIVAMKWGQSEDLKVPHVLSPTQFDLKSTEDYIYELKLAEEAGLSNLVQSKLVADYLYSAYEGSVVSERFIETIIHADRLFAIGDMDINSMKDTIQPWESVLHTSAFTFVENLIAANAEWIDKPLTERVTDLQNLAKQTTPVRVNAAVENLV